MRTTVILPEDLIKELMKETGETSKTRLVRRSLEEMLKRVRRENLKRLRGQVHLDLDLDSVRRKDLL
ncbi:MAG: type II toxin-antitoxin system VapB family antitoxin [Candidatus Aminicenantaceae bacterium]